MKLLPVIDPMYRLIIALHFKRHYFQHIIMPTGFLLDRSEQKTSSSSLRILGKNKKETHLLWSKHGRFGVFGSFINKHPMGGVNNEYHELEQ